MVCENLSSSIDIRNVRPDRKTVKSYISPV